MPVLRFLTCSYLIPTFLIGLKALQDEALRCQNEKQESNRNKRAAQQMAKILEIKAAKLRAIEPESIGESMDGDYGGTVQKCRWEVRGMEATEQGHQHAV
jgi:hypothetical protein